MIFVVFTSVTVLSNRPGATRIGANVTGLDELNCQSGAKSVQQIMKLVLLKLTLEILSMQISKHAYLWTMFAPNILFNDS